MNLKHKIRRLLGRGPTIKELKAGGAEIGEDVWIGTTKIDPTHPFLLRIGDHVTLSDCRILMHDASTKRALGYSKVGRVWIGSHVFIGADAVIMPNVKIGNCCIIGAGAVVTKDIPDNSVAVGNPAHVIGSYSDYISRSQKELKECPFVYHTRFSEKTLQEINQMKQDLMDGGIGYDI